MPRPRKLQQMHVPIGLAWRKPPFSTLDSNRWTLDSIREKDQKDEERAGAGSSKGPDVDPGTAEDQSHLGMSQTQALAVFFLLPEMASTQTQRLPDTVEREA